MYVVFSACRTNSRCMSVRESGLDGLGLILKDLTNFESRIVEYVDRSRQQRPTKQGLLGLPSIPSIPSFPTSGRTSMIGTTRRTDLGPVTADTPPIIYQTSMNSVQADQPPIPSTTNPEVSRLSRLLLETKQIIRSVILDGDISRLHAFSPLNDSMEIFICKFFRLVSNRYGNTTINGQRPAPVSVPTAPQTPPDLLTDRSEMDEISRSQPPLTTSVSPYRNLVYSSAEIRDKISSCRKKLVSQPPKMHVS
jgi:hypothetical protein